MFILVALFVLGGDTLTDFALALLVGILIGTYSSVFVAAPLVVALERGHRGTARDSGVMLAREPGAAGPERREARPGAAIAATAPTAAPGAQRRRRKPAKRRRRR
jgi:SecD/SecF fusion protein